MFPAGAGMNRTIHRAGDGIMDVPRRRGDEPEDPMIDPREAACSPQARG